MNESRRRDAERHLLDPCRPEPTHLGTGVGRLGPPPPAPPVFSTSCETVSHCFRSQPFRLSLQIRSHPPHLRLPDLVALETLSPPTCPLLSDPRGKDSWGGAAEQCACAVPADPPLTLPAPSCHGDACMLARAWEGHAGQFLGWCDPTVGLGRRGSTL